MKANPNPRDPASSSTTAGLNFECVSPGEIARVLEVLPQIDRKRILFTPNFAPRTRIRAGARAGRLGHARQSVSAAPLGEGVQGPRALRPHRHGAGPRPSRARADGRRALEVRRAAVRDRRARRAREEGGRPNRRAARAHRQRRADARRVARHGPPAAEAARAPAGRALRRRRRRPRRAGEGGAGRARLARARRARSTEIKQGLRRAARCSSSRADTSSRRPACLLARVTQTKGKGDVQYVGVGTGMNSLIRPALYGAYHDIVNLTRLGKPATELVTVVGPICETGDRLGIRSAAAAREGERRAADRERRRLRLRDELALQPARAGRGSADLTPRATRRPEPTAVTLHT